MAKFLHSRTGTLPVDEILEQNVLSCAHLRSLVAGDFYLQDLQSCFLMLHEKGIFVLKQCHCNGMIHGEKDALQWMDFNYLGDVQPFINPLLENGENIERLQKILKLPKEDFHSCIVFDVQCELRRVPDNSEEFSLLRVDQLENFFAALLQGRPVRYTHNQLSALNDIFLLVSAEGK